ncbi:hypothetical protein GURASL_13550 [Geotalea uraniireducens]|uniref:Peptidase n=1 Tax=Geotalea uraniireducens TaxID=351604 RepID=A0ABM8EIV9_9BACT|nr:hypothetical protein [Geotalea uraniireducens]BDV42432.1 hypothetical protein GURASL_13550 [Geotalea uraniireducens]
MTIANDDMTGWDLVFRAGTHVDSNGNTRTWTTADLDKIVASINPGYHEPPVVIGHPSDNAPAFGWVAAGRRVGVDLYLKYKDVAEEFKEWTQRKLFKKKSISVYPDGSLRHVGYLGAMPPAIKGLPDYQFSDGDRGQAVTYEFSDWRMTTLGRIVMRMRDYLVEKEGTEKADGIISPWDVQDMLTPPPESDDIKSSCYKEPHEEGEMKPEEVSKIVADAMAAGLQQFGETMGKTIKGLEAQITALKQGQASERESNLKREFREFLMTPEMQKRVPEGSREATINQMMTLTSAEPVQFGEGDNKTSKAALDVYKDQLRALPEVVQFGEHATKNRVGDVEMVGELDAVAIARQASEFVEAEAKAGRAVTVSEAVTHVTAQLQKGGAQ